MIRNTDAQFCWLDLATVDSERAIAFYQRMFGWQVQTKKANGGEFVQFVIDNEQIASLYQLSPQQIAQGVPSHWTPYVGVGNIERAASKATALGGQIIVQPFGVDGTAKVSLITDVSGALFGLWENKRNE